MAITKQVYLWELYGDSTYQSVTNPSIPYVNGALPNAGETFSIFTGGYGNNVTESNLVRDGSFVVIDRFGSTPGLITDTQAFTVGGGGRYELDIWKPNGFVNIWIDTTGYYQDPQNVSSLGISGNAAPYPETEGIRPVHYSLNPSIYVEPFITWDVRYTMMNDLKNYLTNLARYPNVAPQVVGVTTSCKIAEVFVQYWLFNGSDALIAEELLKLGIPVNVDNSEWFRRQLVKQQGLETETWKRYLSISKAYLDMEKKREDYYGERSKE
jgi:hypothetical protein